MGAFGRAFWLAGGGDVAVLLMPASVLCAAGGEALVSLSLVSL